MECATDSEMAKVPKDLLLTRWVPPKVESQGYNPKEVRVLRHVQWAPKYTGTVP